MLLRYTLLFFGFALSATATVILFHVKVLRCLLTKLSKLYRQERFWRNCVSY